MTPAHSDFYEQGIELFNEGRFFECHEAWEEIWKRSDGELKLFYQGLIQAAVAILHAQRGNLEGARSLYEKASAKLDKIPHEHMGLAIGELRIELRRFHRNRNPRRRHCAPRRHRACGASRNEPLELDEDSTAHASWPELPLPRLGDIVAGRKPGEVVRRYSYRRTGEGGLASSAMRAASPAPEARPLSAGEV